jgi:hypothetical protein
MSTPNFSNPELAAIALAALAALIAIQRIRDAAWEKKLKDRRELMRELDRRANYASNILRPRDLL